MALKHYAFSFDVNRFQKSISPLIAAVDEGNLRPLYDEANKTIQFMAQGAWLLDEAGSPLLGLDEIDRVNFAGVPRTQPIKEYLGDSNAVHPGDIGYWLLLVMSRYLEKSCGIGGDYPILETALANAGWSYADCERLLRGLPCCLLMKSDCKRLSLRTDNDPYWHWIVPSHAQSSGWLSHHQVVRLLDEISSVRPTIQGYDPHLFPNPWNLTGEALVDSQRDFIERLQNAYNKAIVMLQHAQQSSRGVFMIMAY